MPRDIMTTKLKINKCKNFTQTKDKNMTVWISQVSHQRALKMEPVNLEKDFWYLNFITIMALFLVGEDVKRSRGHQLQTAILTTDLMVLWNVAKLMLPTGQAETEQPPGGLSAVGKPHRRQHGSLLSPDHSTRFSAISPSWQCDYVVEFSKLACTRFAVPLASTAFPLSCTRARTPPVDWLEKCCVARSESLCFPFTESGLCTNTASGPRGDILWIWQSVLD